LSVGSAITYETVRVRARFAGPSACTWASSRTSFVARLGTTHPWSKPQSRRRFVAGTSSCRSEAEALLLEGHLISELDPILNVKRN
jgi:hypothetical protein